MSKETGTKKKETGTNEIKVKANGALATMNFEADAGFSTGTVGQEDLALPFLKVLGQLSPEVNKMNGKYVKGAEAGMIYNSVTNDLYDGEKGVKIIPCYYKLEYVEWKDRGTDSAGSPVNIYPSSSDIMTKTTRGADYKDRLTNGNYIEKTASHFVIVDEGVPSTALIAMKSTQLKISRKWNSMMQSIKMKGKNGLFTPASFSHVYQLRTVPLSNDKGQWFGWEVSKLGPVQNADLYQQAKAFAESIAKGDVQAKHGEETETQAETHF